jgi:hypothetical protein
MTTNRASPTVAAPSRGYLFEIFLVSFAALLLEISYTRVVSFKLFYYYTYLTIGLALLGIGCGGVIVAISGRLQRDDTDTVLIWSALMGAVSVPIGYLVIALTTIDTLSIWEYHPRATFSNILRLLLICLALFAAFLPIGVIIATLFARGTDQINRLYFADLLGAGIACLIVVFLLNHLGPPAAIMLAGAVLGVVALRLTIRHNPRVSPLAALLAVALAIGVAAPGILPEQRADTTKSFRDTAVIYSKWSALFRVDVNEATPDVRLLMHDGLLGSAIYRFDGNVSSLTRYDTDERKLPFATLGASPDDVLIIGAAGGNEVLASLYFDAGHIDAVELNPVTYSLVTKKYADFAGHLADNPKVNYVRGEGRSFLARQDKKYDLIWYPAPDSYSANAAAAGAFVLSESYLYTREAITESLDHLAPNGIIAWHYGEFDFDAKPNRTARYVNTVREALRERGVADTSRNIIVATTPATLGGKTLSTVLVKATPFTREEIDNFVGALESLPGSVLRFAPDHPIETNVLSELLNTPDGDIDRWNDTYAYDVSSITDDGPFFWHFTPFRDVIGDFDKAIDRTERENSVGERVLLLLLGVAILFAAVFLLLPFVAIRSTWSALPRKKGSALYFASLGFGFIFFEIVLIQRLTLFLGYPTYSLTVTLASILIFTGVGAFLSARLEPRSSRLVPSLLAAIVALTLFLQFALPEITGACLGWALPARVVLVFVILAPLGICLGLFMPLGLGAVARMTEFSREYVAWGWAVNGFSSVIGAVLSTILAMTFGFRGVLFFALIAYVTALGALHRLLAASPTVAAGS